MIAAASWSRLVRAEVDRWADTVGDLRITDTDRHAWTVELFELRDLIRALRGLADDLESCIARSLDDGETVVVDGRRYTRTREIRRRSWDIDGLVRDVLDSRLVDRTTGEVYDETPVDKLRHVWRLDGSSVRIQALRERGLADDEYCTIERGRWRLRDVT